MKTLICKCSQCTVCRKCAGKKSGRLQTYQVRAAKARNREILKTAPLDEIEDLLSIKVKVDYYG